MVRGCGNGYGAHNHLAEERAGDTLLEVLSAARKETQQSAGSRPARAAG